MIDFLNFLWLTHLNPFPKSNIMRVDGNTRFFRSSYYWTFFKHFIVTVVPLCCIYIQTWFNFFTVVLLYNHIVVYFSPFLFFISKKQITSYIFWSETRNTMLLSMIQATAVKLCKNRRECWLENIKYIRWNKRLEGLARYWYKVVLNKILRS